MTKTDEVFKIWCMYSYCSVFNSNVAVTKSRLTPQNLFHFSCGSIPIYCFFIYSRTHPAMQHFKHEHSWKSIYVADTVTSDEWRSSTKDFINRTKSRTYLFIATDSFAYTLTPDGAHISDANYNSFMEIVKAWKDFLIHQLQMVVRFLLDGRGKSLRFSRKHGFKSQILQIKFLAASESCNFDTFAWCSSVDRPNTVISTWYAQMAVKLSSCAYQFLSL